MPEHPYDKQELCLVQTSNFTCAEPDVQEQNFCSFAVASAHAKFNV